MTNEPTSENAEDRYRQILEAAPDAMVVVGADGRISFINRQTELLFGYERSELVDRPLDELIPARFRGSHGGHVARYFSAPMTRPMGSGLELFGLRKDGTEIQIEVSLSPVRTRSGTSVSAAIRDIGERKRIEGIAKLNADRLSSAVESIQDAVALFDANDELAMCNSACRSLFADSVSGPLLGKTYAELLDAWLGQLSFATEDERARFRGERLAERREPRGSFDVRARDGRRLRVNNRRTIEGGIVQTIWDLSDDVRREEELHQARVAADAGSAAKSEFLSSMSHELRTPLNAILGFAQLLQRDKKEPLSERHRERAEQIVRGGEHLLRLIDDILDLSRIEAGGVSISNEEVNLVDVLDELEITLDAMATRGRVALKVAPLPDQVPSVTADRTRLAQILMNLGSNAIKYNRPGGTVTFTVSRPSADSDCARTTDGESPTIRITVADTGIGIPTDKQSKLFQPFQRAGQETGPIEGTGIGLVISKRLAELMGGSVGFRSEPGTGSEFWVDIPVHARAPRSSPPFVARGKETAALDDGAHRQILYVEDNPANVAFMRDLVGSLDAIELVTAPTAEMGVELVRQIVPDVVIMDINLPGMSGLDALRVLRDDPRTAQIPVIALTAAASDRDKQRGMQAGFYRYLTKPVKVDELVAALEALLAATHSGS